MEITIAELLANPQLLETAMENNKNWFVVNRYLTDARNVPLEIIEKHYENAKKLNTTKHCDNYLGYLRKALKIKPTPIQKTMTPFQLLQTGSRLWALPFTPREICSINNLATKLKKRGRDFSYIEPLFDLSLAADEFHMLNLRLLHRVDHH